MLYPALLLTASLGFPPALAFGPNLLADLPITSYHWALCIVGWIASLGFFLTRLWRDDLIARRAIRKALSAAQCLEADPRTAVAPRASAD